ncbi:expressed protein, partial [Phakopsora pachyrhizi]
MAPGGFEIFLIVIALGMIVALVTGAFVLYLKTSHDEQFLYIQESNAMVPGWNNPTTVTLPPGILKEKSAFDPSPPSSAFLRLKASRQTLKSHLDSRPKRQASSSTISSSANSSFTNYKLDDSASGHLNQLGHLRKVNVVQAPKLSVTEAAQGIIGGKPTGNNLHARSDSGASRNLQFSTALATKKPSIDSISIQMNAKDSMRRGRNSDTSSDYSHEELDEQAIIHNHIQPYPSSIPTRPSLNNLDSYNRQRLLRNTPSYSDLNGRRLQSSSKSTHNLSLDEEDRILKRQQLRFSKSSGALDSLIRPGNSYPRFTASAIQGGSRAPSLDNLKGVEVYRPQHRFINKETIASYHLNGPSMPSTK